MRLGEDACSMQKQSPQTTTNTNLLSLLLVVSWMPLWASSASSEGVAPVGPLLIEIISSTIIMTINVSSPCGFEKATENCIRKRCRNGIQKWYPKLVSSGIQKWYPKNGAMNILSWGNRGMS